MSLMVGILYVISSGLKNPLKRFPEFTPKRNFGIAWEENLSHLMVSSQGQWGSTGYYREFAS